MQKPIAAALVAVIGVASFGLSVGVALAERPRGPNCVAAYSQCKAKAGGDDGIGACVQKFNKCVSDNKDQHYNPYGYPNRIGDNPAVLSSVPGVSIGKPGVTAGAKAITSGAATITTKVTTFGATTVNPGVAATATINAAPAKSPTAVSNGVPGHTLGGQAGRRNFHMQ